jgi:hypothetical protein
MKALLKFFEIFVLVAVVGTVADAAQAPNSRSANNEPSRTTNSANTARSFGMPGGIGGVIGGNLGANVSIPNVPKTGPGSCVGGGCNPTPSVRCTPGATQPCTTSTGAAGTQVCQLDGTWGTCVSTAPVPTPASYTIEDCMNALLACINSGALSGGLTDLYDSNIRNSIISGSGICRSVVDNCVARLAVYHSASDVWIDFNSRVIQPQYYNFVLRKTGLTPNQAENTCWLLDKNTYGSSFAAVTSDNMVMNEYGKIVHSYNMTDNQVATWGGETGSSKADRPNAGASSEKKNPQGVDVNTDAWYDGNRGHYARWDAKTGECLVRIAAYNKNDLIYNNWLFGAAGDEKAAEVWKVAGTSFTCNKSLFEFSLLNNTATVAVVGAGATGLATGITAVSSINAQKKNTGIFDCDNEKHRKELRQAIRDNNLEGALQLYIEPKSSSSVEGKNPDTDYSKTDPTLMSSDTELNHTACVEIVNLQDELQRIKQDPCYSKAAGNSIILNLKVNGIVASNSSSTGSNVTKGLCDEDGNTFKWRALIKNYQSRCTECKESGICCTNPEITKLEIDQLSNNLSKISDILRDGGKEMNKVLRNSLIAAGVGAGATGLATAITAFVEKNNINCRIGDDLDRVAMGKSGKIDTLKNYYTKWNLKLPETAGPAPTVFITDCATWQTACGNITGIPQCIGATIHYKPAGAASALMIHNACAIDSASGKCIENKPVAISHGACSP